MLMDDLIKCTDWDRTFSLAICLGQGSINILPLVC